MSIYFKVHICSIKIGNERKPCIILLLKVCYAMLRLYPTRKYFFLSLYIEVDLLIVLQYYPLISYSFARRCLVLRFNFVSGINRIRYAMRLRPGKSLIGCLH